MSRGRFLVMREEIGCEALKDATQVIQRRLFRDVGVGRQSGREGDIAGIAGAGENDDLQVLQLLLFTQPTKHAETGRAGHVDIEEKDFGQRRAAILRRGLAEESHGVVTVRECRDGAGDTETPQLPLEDEDVVRVVVDDGDAAENPTGCFVELCRAHTNRNSTRRQSAQAGSVRGNSGTFNAGMELGV